MVDLDHGRRSHPDQHRLVRMHATLQPVPDVTHPEHESVIGMLPYILDV